eukprot:1295595-Prymnesium_polylepis.1
MVASFGVLPRSLPAAPPSPSLPPSPSPRPSRPFASSTHPPATGVPLLDATPASRERTCGGVTVQLPPSRPPTRQPRLRPSDRPSEAVLRAKAAAEALARAQEAEEDGDIAD